MTKPISAHLDTDGRPACPDCGCTHAPVVYTRHVGGTTVRRRRCRNCERTFTTRETAAAPVVGLSPARAASAGDLSTDL